MANTANYGLYLTESSSESFLSWRNKINGREDSNMVKIDTILGSKADSSTAISTVLLASGWAEKESCYEQTITIDGISLDTNGIISISQGASDDERAAARSAMIVVAGQGDKSLTVVADGVVPQVDIPVSIIIIN